MVFYMKMTIDIDDSVMHRVREEAARRGRTVSELVEEGLRRVLDEPELDADGVRELLPQWRSGGARVDVADRDALHERMDRD
jgi:predicted transcriptional regulator